MQKSIDNRAARSKATQEAMMRAAEKLIAKHGVENLSIREIVAEAGQKNESALQYHFKNLSGLLEAIHAQRAGQVREIRTQLLSELLSTTTKPQLRQLCALMVRPSFELARSDTDFRRYIKAFGHVLAVNESSPLKTVARQGGGGASGTQLGQLLRDALQQLDSTAYRMRMEAAVILCSASMSNQAKQTSAFRGPKSDLFLNALIDALQGLLSAPVSKETTVIANSLKKT